MSDKKPAIYLITNKPNGTLYCGVTSNLLQHIWQHKTSETHGFSSKYNLNKLVYFELLDDMYSAIVREKQIKAGSRKTKIRLIQAMNPLWLDLYNDIAG